MFYKWKGQVTGGSLGRAPAARPAPAYNWQSGDAILAVCPTCFAGPGRGAGPGVGRPFLGARCPVGPRARPGRPERPGAGPARAQGGSGPGPPRRSGQARGAGQTCPHPSAGAARDLRRGHWWRLSAPGQRPRWRRRLSGAGPVGSRPVHRLRWAGQQRQPDPVGVHRHPSGSPGRGRAQPHLRDGEPGGAHLRQERRRRPDAYAAGLLRRTGRILRHRPEDYLRCAERPLVRFIRLLHQ